MNSPLPRNAILIGDTRERLAELPSDSIDCVITSPPFYRQRSFVPETTEIGLERSVENWVHSLRGVVRQVRRVLKPTGSLWLDLADTYSQGRSEGAPSKSLLLAPELLLMALLRDGWIVRNKVIWAKTNPMPSAVRDRLEATYDVVYFLVRSPTYFFDLDAIRGRRQTDAGGAIRLDRNPGDVWPIAVANYRGAHFGTFPPKLVDRPLLASCPERICMACGVPWKTRSRTRRQERPRRFERATGIRRHPIRYDVVRTDPRLEPSCSCGAPTHPGVVLDPFFGTGTVGAVAEQHGRDWIGIEINPEYVKLAEARLAKGAPRSEAA